MIDFEREFRDIERAALRAGIPMDSLDAWAQRHGKERWRFLPIGILLHLKRTLNDGCAAYLIESAIGGQLAPKVTSLDAYRERSKP